MDVPSEEVVQTYEAKEPECLGTTELAIATLQLAHAQSCALDRTIAEIR